MTRFKSPQSCQCTHPTYQQQPLYASQHPGCLLIMIFRINMIMMIMTMIMVMVVIMVMIKIVISNAQNSATTTACLVSLSRPVCSSPSCLPSLSFGEPGHFQKIYSTSDTKFNLHPILVHPKPVHQHHEYSYLLIFNVYNHIYIQFLLVFIILIKKLHKIQLTSRHSTGSL